MIADLLDHEATFRLSSFALFLGLFALLEYLYPRKPYTNPRTHRWLTNFSIAVLDSLVVRIALPLLAVQSAWIAEQNGWGLWHVWNISATWLELGLNLLILDFAIYFQHRLFHKIPLLWRLHRMHHSDVKIDVSTGLRFHPIEIVLSMLFKIALVVTLGISPVAVIIFEILLNASSLFNHANWNLKKWDPLLQNLLVTPDMHRIHHSSQIRETNSNYGFCLSLWDRVFKSYCASAALPVEKMQIGLENYRSDQEQTLLPLLKNPFI